MVTLIPINELISYIPSSDSPLSAEVVLIKGKEYTWVYDVGRNQEALDYLKSQNNLCVILSHFHGDHIENISSLETHSLYVSKQTEKYTHNGILVSSDMFINDGSLSIHIFLIPSSHSKGCLGLEINNSISFIGDSIYGNSQKSDSEAYNYQLTQQEIACISKLNSDNYYCSHRFSQPLNKNEVLTLLNEHLIK